MSKNVSVDARGLLRKFAVLEDAAKSGVREVVAAYTRKGAEDIVQLLSKPVTENRKGMKQRSRPGQAPRSETGRFRRSVKTKLSPKGWVGTITTDDTASDKKGRRYPWMLESGTKRVKKRPSFKKVQRKLKKPFNRAIADAMTAAVRRADR